MQRKEAFGYNKTDQPQVLAHNGLRDLTAVPVAPGVYTLTEGCRATIQPGQAFRVPMVIWNTTPATCRLAWVQEITEDEFMARLALSAEPEPTPTARYTASTTEPEPDDEAETPKGKRARKR